MRAFVVTGPRRAGVEDVPEPVAVPGEVVVQVTRAGVCGTDVEFYTGEMAYLHSGRESYPVRIGHEWAGVVREIGAGVDPAWLGRRVVGDTMIGCGRCRRCKSGRHHVCTGLVEIGCSLGRAGALAERVAIPATQLIALPDAVDDAMGAMVEPGGNAVRAVRAAAVRAGDRLLVLGAGTIGLLAALFARAEGMDVHLLGRSGRSLGFARSLASSRPGRQTPCATSPGTASSTPRTRPSCRRAPSSSWSRAVMSRSSGSPAPRATSTHGEWRSGTSRSLACSAHRPASRARSMPTRLEGDGGRHARVGPIEILVNNAGLQYRAPLEDVPQEAWDRLVAVNLTGVFLVAQAVARRMIPRGHGKIVNVCSVQSELARPTIAPYVATKGAVKSLTRGMCADWARHGVQVNGIGPGYFVTDLTRSLADDPRFDDWVRARTPAARWGEVAELVGAVVFLASDASSYVNGQVIYVDGGMTATL